MVKFPYLFDICLEFSPILLYKFDDFKDNKVVDFYTKEPLGSLIDSANNTLNLTLKNVNLVY